MALFKQHDKSLPGSTHKANSKSAAKSGSPPRTHEHSRASKAEATANANANAATAGGGSPAGSAAKPIMLARGQRVQVRAVDAAFVCCTKSPACSVCTSHLSLS